MLCVRLPACVRAQDPRGKGYGLGWAVPLRIESPFAPQPPEGRGTQHSCGDVFPFARDGETAPSLCLKTSQLPCQYITCMHNSLSFSWIAKILTFPTILTLRCLSNETLVIRHKSYGMKSLTILG